jgi:hypothetical protein
VYAAIDRLRDALAHRGRPVDADWVRRLDALVHELEEAA